MKILDSYFENCDVIIIDIETTGLFPERNKVIVGGLLSMDANAPAARQFFAETKDGEKALLEAYYPLLDAADIIISFNGDSFDIPFLNRRFAKNGIAYRIPPEKSFDLYRVIRQSGFSGILPNLKQTTVERYLGIAGSRTDTITGRESIELYNEYVRTGDKRMKETILLHNHDDLLQLNRLMAILKNIDLHRVMFSNGFHVIGKPGKIAVRSIKFGQGAIMVKGSHSGFDADFISHTGPYSFDLSLENRSVNIRIPLQREHRHYYVDLNDFDFDTSDFAKYSNCRSGYLIVSSGSNRNHAEINHLVKRICKEILGSF